MNIFVKMYYPLFPCSSISTSLVSIKAWRAPRWPCPAWWTRRGPCWRSRRATCWRRWSGRPWATTWRSTGKDTSGWSSWWWRCLNCSTHTQRWRLVSEKSFKRASLSCTPVSLCGRFIPRLFPKTYSTVFFFFHPRILKVSGFSHSLQWFTL